MTEDDLAILAQQDMATLARWWSELNSWEWPAELPNPPTKESRWNNTDDGRAWEIMRWISEAVGERAISHHWNVLTPHQFQMTEDEFNDFWRGTYEGHGPSRKRHEANTRDRIARIWPQKQA